MGYLSEEKKQQLLDSLATDHRFLGKLRNSRISEYEEETIEKFELEAYEKNGYEFKPSRLKKKIKVIKYKEHNVAFENKCWCLMYDLGFKILNKNDKFILPYGKNEGESQQIDVVAVNDDVVILIECKSSRELIKKDHRPYIDTLQKKIAGFNQSIKELFGDRRVKFMFATNNQKLGPTNIGILNDSNVFYLNNSSQDYIRSLIDTYKKSAHYQFMSLVFKGEIIKRDKIRIPAIKGKMGGNTYYMFSIEPETLLRIGFVLHRVKANAEDFPTYQRLLKTNRIKSLSDFINAGGYFPNSVILNFDTKGLKKSRQLEWEDAGQRDDSLSDHGILKIPNSFAIAYIIDGQHRVYGYSYADNSELKFKQTIPVVAFENLSNERQLEMFMEINENQTAISRNLKETLKEDIYWMSPKPNLRMQALMSGINNFMGSENGFKIANYLSIGEDNKEITMGTVIDGIKDSGFLPVVQKGEMIDDIGVLYKIGVQDHFKEMNRIKHLLGNFLCEAFDFVIDNYPELWGEKGGLIRSSRGAYAYIRTLGELNVYLSNKKELNKEDDYEVRIEKLNKYLKSLFNGLTETRKNTIEYEKTLKAYGGGNKKVWNHLYTSLINNKFKDFTTPDYEVYLETQDEEIQAEANKLIGNIEQIIKKRTLNYIYADCGGESSFRKKYYDLFEELRKRAELKEIEYENNFGSEKKYEWNEMFNIVDYLNLAEKGWGKPLPEHNIERISKYLSMRMDKESHDPVTNVKYYHCGNDPSYKTGSKWMRKFNIIRSNSAHFGSRNKKNGINKAELNMLRLMYNGLTRVV
jgi:DNA sulfur modification protein DndB